MEHLFSEMQQAFKIIKNNIAHGWKDLARALPYEQEKDMGELNTEIKIIEYENQGQLKEQVTIMYLLALIK